jgi:LPXTG-site transpeptidase (sortase) family protein
MKIKILFKQLVLLAFLGGLTFSLIVFFLFFKPQDTTPSNKNLTLVNPADGELINSVWNKTPEKKTSVGLPIRLQIPKINIDTTLESVGLTLDGAVDVPKTSSNAAWFNLGTRPGDIGSAVITGHFGRWKNGEDSVFDNLHKLEIGDKLNIIDDNEVVFAFIVRERRSYTPEEYTPEVFISNDGKSHLNLITCGGTWNKTSKSYSKRLVIFTDKE